MYAVVKIADRQVKVTNGLRLRVPKLDVEEGATHTIDDVLLVGDDGDTQIGTPLVAGASVTAKVLGHGRDKKVVVFKMKRRKGYRNKNGHRQRHTGVKITDIKA